MCEDRSVRHQLRRGRFIYLVNTCASLIRLHITLKEFHPHQSHHRSIPNHFLSLPLLLACQDGIKSWLSFRSFNVAFFPAPFQANYISSRAALPWPADRKPYTAALSSVRRCRNPAAGLEPRQVEAGNMEN